MHIAKSLAFELQICDLDWIRTNDPQLRRLLLYPTELPDPKRAQKYIFKAIINAEVKETSKPAYSLGLNNGSLSVLNFSKRTFILALY